MPLGAIAGGALGGYLGYRADNGTPAREVIQDAIETLDDLMTPPQPVSPMRESFQEALDDLLEGIGKVKAQQAARAAKDHPDVEIH